ncbi:MAG: LapA family protein [Pseudomonadales bacterium]|nr:LapA family protein [Halioglobus sp.]MCP5131194.1 LapA family protein [Pseudomonadales bacterium]
MKRLRHIITLIILLAAVALGVLFALQNTQLVPLDLLVYSFEPRSLALWVLSAFALGGVAGLVVSSAYMLQSRAALGSARRQLARARTELDRQGATEPGAGV